MTNTNDFIPSPEVWQLELREMHDDPDVEWSDVEAMGWDTYEGYVLSHEKMNALRRNSGG